MRIILISTIWLFIVLSFCKAASIGDRREEDIMNRDDIDGHERSN